MSQPDQNANHVRSNNSLTVPRDPQKYCRMRNHCPSSLTFDQIVARGATRAPSFGRVTQRFNVFSHIGRIHIMAGDAAGQVSITDIIGVTGLYKKAAKEIAKDIAKDKAKGAAKKAMGLKHVIE